MKLLLITLALSVTTFANASSKQAMEKIQLEQIITCKKAAKPKEAESIITSLGGRSIVQNPHTAEYSIPNPIDIFGRPVTRVTIHKMVDDDGYQHHSYSAPFKGESIETMAKFADIPQNSSGSFRKEVGAHDLTLRTEVGVSFITCENDVRTIGKTVKDSIYKRKPKQLPDEIEPL